MSKTKSENGNYNFIRFTSITHLAKHYPAYHVANKFQSQPAPHYIFMSHKICVASKCCKLVLYMRLVRMYNKSGGKSEEVGTLDKLTLQVLCALLLHLQRGELISGTWLS